MTHKRHHSKKARLSPKIVVPDAIAQFVDPTSSYPPDSTMAVGPYSYICFVNSVLKVFDKQLNYPIFESTAGNLWGSESGGDIQVIYDEVTQRFFLTAWDDFVTDSTVTVDPPNPAEGTYPTGTGGQPVSQAPFSISATIEATVPANADTTVTNDLTGKIAFIETDGFQSGSVTKGNNAAAAGAIGCLFWQSSPEDSLNINGSSLVPSVIVDFANGSIISDGLSQPMTGTIANGAPIVETNRFLIAVSKTNDPKAIDDWYTFIYTPVTDGVTTLDFPKILVDENKFYWATQDFGEFGFLGSHIFTFDKNSLVNGIGVVLLQENFFPDTNFIWPTQKRFKHDHKQPPTMFVGDNTTNENPINPTALLIYNHNFEAIEVPVPTPMMTDFTVLMTQPATGPFEVPGLEADLGHIPSVVYQDSLWLTQTWTPDSNRIIIRWYELDISKMDKHKIKIKQWGDINPCDGSSCAYGSVNIDKEGNVAIGFTVCGPNMPPTPAYTGRLHDDPKGTLRYPYQFPIQSLYSYDGGEQDRGFAITNRWGDYSAMVVDPDDHETFYFCSEYPQQADFAVDPEALISFAWSNVITSFRIRHKHSENKPQKKCKSNSLFVTFANTSQLSNPDYNAPAFEAYQDQINEGDIPTEEAGITRALKPTNKKPANKKPGKYTKKQILQKRHTKSKN